MTAAMPGLPGESGPTAALLDVSFRHLRRLGLLAEDARPAWRLLGGGVSNWVVLFDCAGGVVVKVALARLRVPEEWLADPARVVTEGLAMQALGARLPSGDLPRVLFVDAEHYVLGMTSAPADAHPWKEDLLRGQVDQPAARQVGALLGRLHGATWLDPHLERRFADLSLFRQLRLDPYHGRAAQVAEARGDSRLAALLRAGAEQMLHDRVTLVHGDFSPKNLLVHRTGTMALDFEVVHWGNPDFDTAFLLNHLVLKALHLPGAAEALRQAAHGFFAAYAEALGRRTLEQIERGALAQVGCLLVARADGKSPAEYLDQIGRARARALGSLVLHGRIPDVDALFDLEAER